eukprot:TRINITY_DN3532_c0_g1_i1.p1 TRINITY_DN3532_c0_g1~~TRINITY_DN3532_c0_g1_i1.p1  ORF type:complete len:502 (-),score=85.92 TRINITY_DN3532_c0_g1_i1:61-1566(-)
MGETASCCAERDDDENAHKDLTRQPPPRSPSESSSENGAGFPSLLRAPDHSDGCVFPGAQKEGRGWSMFGIGCARRQTPRTVQTDLRPCTETSPASTPPSIKKTVTFSDSPPPEAFVMGGSPEEAAFAERELRLQDSSEAESLAALRLQLGAQLYAANGCPADLRHDIGLLRFLRGNNGDVAITASLLAKAIEYRKDLASKSPYNKLLPQWARDTEVDMHKLPHADEVLQALPLRAIDGLSAGGLPILAICPKLVNFEALADPDFDAKLDTFFKAHLEQRAIVLHNLSLKQRRMVKFVDVRDLHGVSIPQMLARGKSFISKLKGLIGVVKDYYPELIHQVVICNAPSAISLLINLISPILNERMRGKMKVFPVNDTLRAIADRLSAQAVWSWIQLAHPNTPLSSLPLPRGGEEYAALWLHKRMKKTWRFSVEGKDARLRYAFVPLPDGKACCPGLSETQAFADKPVGGTFVSPSEGVLVFALSNATGWTERTVSLELDVND